MRLLLYIDEEDRELLDESDNEFSCSDGDSEAGCYSLIIIHPRAKTEDEIHHLKNVSLYFRVLFVVVFFWWFSLWFFAQIHFKLKAKKPNEVDWFAKVIRINRLIFYTSWYLTQNGLYGCATGSKFLFN